ncbi:MAG: chemotaxis protein CheW [Pseudomonadota bacterium]|nr:chemotaxis protein CheW [Pseudomonadota bacterium]
MTIEDQMFGIPVLQVQTVLGPQTITRVPLAPREITGALNLRGHIVTTIDVRTRLGLAGKEHASGMNVVVDHKGELYSLVVDAVGAVLKLPSAEFEKNPATLDPVWSDVSMGIYRLDERLMIVFDVERLLDLNRQVAA